MDAASSNGDLSAAASRAIAAAVREELARRRISRQRLADDARISLSTLEKALAGRRPFTLATTIRLEQALGRVLRRPDEAAAGVAQRSGVAPESLGSYSRDAARWLEGDYLTLRPSFDGGGAVFAYRTEVFWDETAGALAFREAAREDAAYTQKGLVSMPMQSGLIYLVTSERGQFRLAILDRPTIHGEMYGLLTTLHAGPGAQLTPASVALALLPLARWPDPAYGKLGEDHPSYGAYRAQVDKIAGQGFAKFLTATRP
ncbi:MAG TPA: helix-turn-helix transcriptional regulator [Caulobacteraceae bacterium]|nr:helix-turn-helix transcriptional regulator [Caulobacteraceae bacterium]